jgi:hypothetical protein
LSVWGQAAYAALLSIASLLLYGVTATSIMHLSLSLALSLCLSRANSLKPLLHPDAQLDPRAEAGTANLEGPTANLVSRAGSSAWNASGFTDFVAFGDSYTDENRLNYFAQNGGRGPPAGSFLPQVRDLPFHLISEEKGPR